MNNHSGSWRVLGFGAAALLLSAAACSDDTEPSDVSRGGSAGTSPGGSKSGASSFAGTSSPTGGMAQGGSAGAAQSGSAGSGQSGSAGSGQSGSAGSGQSDSAGSGQGGSAGDGPETNGGEGGALGEAGAGLGGAAGNAGDTGSVGGAGMAGAGGEGGASDPDGCDYSETNSPQDEATGLVVSDVPVTICAKANNGDFEPVQSLVDRDRFKVVIPADSDALIKLEISDPQALTGAILSVNDFPTYAVDGRAVIRHRYYGGDQATISVETLNEDGDVAAPVPYKLSIVLDDLDARCPASAAAATFTEANDGDDDRDNDVYEVVNGVPYFTAASDTAEPTGITVAGPGQTYRVDGSAADLWLVGEYTDVDGYAFHTGPNVSQLTIRGDWSSDERDFDVYLFQAGKQYDWGRGYEWSTVSGEYLTVLVEPDTDYVLTMNLGVGASASDYSLTLCSEAFSLLGD